MKKEEKRKQNLSQVSHCRGLILCLAVQGTTRNGLSNYLLQTRIRRFTQNRILLRKTAISKVQD